MHLKIICVVLCFLSTSFAGKSWKGKEEKHKIKDVTSDLLEKLEELESLVHKQSKRIKVLENTVERQREVIDDLEKAKIEEDRFVIESGDVTYTEINDLRGTVFKIASSKYLFFVFELLLYVPIYFFQCVFLLKST